MVISSLGSQEQASRLLQYIYTHISHTPHTDRSLRSDQSYYANISVLDMWSLNICRIFSLIDKAIFSLPWLYIMTLTCFTELYMWLLVFKMTLTFLISPLHLKSLLIAESIKCHNHWEGGSRPTKEEQFTVE